jgi:tRNA(fMet)-specific endonuclease VapC
MKYLLDTSVISAVIKDPDGKAAERVAALRAGEPGTSIIVSAELKFGYTKESSRRLEALIERFLANVEIAPWEAPADMAYARLRAELEKKGKLIGQNDMLIAAHALTLDATLVTDNEREFSRVRGLRVENWVPR